MSKEHHFSQEVKKVDHTGEANEKVKRPEVGDVWNYEGIKRIVVAEGVKTCDFFGVVDAIQVLGDDYHSHWYNAKLFAVQAEYLGKAKIDVEELFDVAEE